MSQRLSLLFLSLLTLVAKPAHPGAFLLDEMLRTTVPDAVMHPIGYDGTGGTVTVSFCIDPGSAFATELVTPTQNAIDTLNALVPTTSNYVAPGESTQVPAGHVDAESILLHEMGHCVGLGHVNLGRIPPPPLDIFFGDAAMSNPGPDGEYTFVNTGADGFWGSADDLRGDDGNLLWFRKMVNDPFLLPVVPPPAYDQTNYTRDLASLPMDDDYTNSGSPVVAAALGYPNTKAIMHSLTGLQAEARALSHDDVTMLRYASSGLNETAGDSDDYVLTLELTSFPCDIPIRFVSLGTQVVGRCPFVPTGPISGSTDHYTATPQAVELNSDLSWFFGSALDLAITKSDGDAEVLPGGDIVYTLEVSNVGSDVDATGVEIEETIPDFTTFNASASDPGWNCVDIVAGSECLLSVGSLSAGGPPVQATFVVTVDNPLLGVEEIFNLVRVSDDGNNGPDPNPGNDLAQESTQIDSGVVFEDGFESGNTSSWSQTAP